LPAFPFFVPGEELMPRRTCIVGLFFLVILGDIALAAGSSGHDKGTPDKEALRTLLENQVLKEDLVGKRVYVSRKPIPGKKYIYTWRMKVQVPPKFSRAWFFFVDDMPEANWEHPCRYVFVDVKTHDSEVVKASLPPKDLDSMVSLDKKQQ